MFTQSFLVKAVQGKVELVYTDLLWFYINILFLWHLYTTFSTYSHNLAKLESLISDFLLHPCKKRYVHTFYTKTLIAKDDLRIFFLPVYLWEKTVKYKLRFFSSKIFCSNTREIRRSLYASSVVQEKST